MDPVDSTGTRVSSRRAFVIAGATFVVGATLGGGVGYRTAVGASQADVDRPADPPPEDDELVELRRLAVDAPIEELIARRLVFLRCATVSYRTDTVLWRGIERLCDAVVRDPAFPDRRLSGRLLAQIIEYAEPEFQRAHAHRVADLRALP
ncbi:MAG: hypothetical protein JNL08_00155 [Planctomycetes bacterium]|nr:hypothetical protein [Planctomycetota bacterium]